MLLKATFKTLTGFFLNKTRIQVHIMILLPPILTASTLNKVAVYSVGA